MSIFTIQTPDGRKLKIEAADQATAIRGAQEWSAANPAQAPDAALNEKLAHPFGANPKPVTPAPGPMDFLTQGMSGLNEGIAMGLGAPVDIATLLMNAGSTGINALTGSNIPQITNPIGGSQRIREGLLAPTIKPESDDPMLKGTRRVMQEVGAWAMPGGGIAARTARPVQTAVRELPAVLASGTGAATAQQVAPGNAAAEFAGQMIGGLTPGAITRAARRPAPPPTVESLRTEKNAAYRHADNLGVAYTPQAFDNLLANVVTRARADRISPTRHEQAYNFIREMTANRGRPLTMTELDQLRQNVYRDLIKPSWRNPEWEADAHFGQIIVDEIDNLIGNASPADVVAGSAQDAANAIIRSRSANTRYRKTQMISDAIEKAYRRTESTGSGGNINNALRQNIRAILDSQSKRRGFSREEIQAMEELVRQGRMENFLRLVGKLSPSGNGLMAMLGIGGTMLNPAIGAASLAGAGAKVIADRGTVNRAIDLQNRVARGAPVVRPFMTPEEARRLAALSAAQATTQMQNNGPLEITVRGGAR